MPKKNPEQSERKVPSIAEAQRLIDEAGAMTEKELRRIGAIYGHVWLTNIRKSKLVGHFRRAMEKHIATQQPTPRKRVCAGKAVSYSTYNLRRPIRVARERPCEASPMKGSRYCYHHQDQG